MVYNVLKFFQCWRSSRLPIEALLAKTAGTLLAPILASEWSWSDIEVCISSALQSALFKWTPDLSSLRRHACCKVWPYYNACGISLAGDTLLFARWSVGPASVRPSHVFYCQRFFVDHVIKIPNMENEQKQTCSKHMFNFLQPGNASLCCKPECMEVKSTCDAFCLYASRVFDQLC